MFNVGGKRNSMILEKVVVLKVPGNPSNYDLYVLSHLSVLFKDAESRYCYMYNPWRHGQTSWLRSY